MGNRRTAVDVGNGRWSRLLACLAVLLPLFCLDAGTCYPEDSAGLQGDISAYTGRAAPEQSGGGSYIVYQRESPSCYRYNTRTGACSCPAGYSAQEISLQDISCNDYGVGLGVYHGYICEK